MHHAVTSSSPSIGPRQAVRIDPPEGFDTLSYLRAEISASAVRENLSRVRGCLSPRTRLCAVVKADCYGHGRAQLGDILAQGADWLAVATPIEALDLRRTGYDGRLLVFFSSCAHADGAELREALRELIARKVTLTIAGFDEVACVAEAARSAGAVADVHVKLDTGMTRSGILAEQAPRMLAAIAEHDSIRLGGLYTHFAAADEPDASFAAEQFDRFGRAVKACGSPKVMLHAANSAATIALPYTHLDMVRPGIALYGYAPSDALRGRVALRPSLRLTGKLMQTKDVPAGTSCGYGLAYRFERPSRVGLVPVGYGDGYLRCLSNRAQMRVAGGWAPVRGRVAMDQTIVELTDIPSAKVGDEVEIISPDPGAPNSVANLARLAGTIPYEITCLLGARVRRVLVD